MSVPVPIERGPRAVLAATICDRVVRAAYGAIEARQRFVMCIAGGSVAEACIPLIARAEIPWPQVHVIWADERAVPVASADSNAGAAMRLWAGTPLAIGASIHPMHADASDLDAAAADHAREIIELFGEAPVIDLALLGVGDDGHIASLFPEHGSLDRTDRLVIAEPNSPKPPPRRLSLSLPFLAGAREIIVAAFGGTKEQAVVAAATGTETISPVARVLRASENVTVMRDD